MPSVDLSIIIVTYNPGSILFDTLDSIPKGVADLTHEVILIDNQSQNDAVDKVRARYPEITIIQNTDNRGFAAANNQGLAVARGEYLLLLNPDVIVGKDALAQLAQYLNDHTEAGIVGPRTYKADKSIALSAFGACTPLMILWQYLGIIRLFPDRVYGAYLHACNEAISPFTVSWLQGHCLLIRRRVYETIGGLDEGLFLFVEEPDFCDRAAKAGWTTVYVPQAAVEHHESTTVSQYPVFKMRHYHLSPLHFFRKRGQNLNVRILKVGFTIELIAKWFVSAVQYRLQPNEVLHTRLAAFPQVIREVWRF